MLASTKILVPQGTKSISKCFFCGIPLCQLQRGFTAFNAFFFPFFVPLPEDTSQTSENFVWTRVSFLYGCCSLRSDYVQKCTPLISALNCNIQRDTQEGYTAQILNHFLCVCLSDMRQLPNCLVVSIKIEISAFVNIPFVLGPL